MTSHTPDPPKRNGYSPITLGDVQPNPPDPFFANLDTPGARLVGAALFLLLFAMSTNGAVAAPLMMVVLLACLLFRMDSRQRALTAVPLTFSTVRLGAQLAGPLGVWRYAVASGPVQASQLQFDSATTWLPLFLAAYLFFTSAIDSHTARVVFWYSLAILLSGLIPGPGDVAVFAMRDYTLFLVILITIAIDLSDRSTTARPLVMETQTARA